MRIIRNLNYVKTKRRNARLSAVGGFILLMSTFFLTLNPNTFIFSYILLIFGFIIFSQGMRDITKWSRPVRNDQVLDRKLGTLGDQYTLIHYAKIGRRVIEHMLVFPGGVLVLTAKEYFGEVNVKGRRWRQGGFGLRRIFGLSGPQLGNPSIETDMSLSAIEKYLEAEQFETDLRGAIVFVDPRTTIDATLPDYPIVLPDELTKFVQEESADERLTLADRARLAELLGGGGTVENAPTSTRRRPVKRRASA
ncbi:MAG TPA: NERD domain-containing protein [Thermomicrobiales bacterium]|jgi:hypothetical protein|nr:NERD domain-containing protein [Thermomicrobiales bacterium]